MLFFKYRLFILKMIFWTIVAALLFSGFSRVINSDWFKPDDFKDTPIMEVRHGQYKMHIPKAFGPHADGGSSELRTMYPGAELLDAPSDEMWEEGEGHKVIETSIDYYPQSKMTFSKFLDYKAVYYGAFENAGEEYGLGHLTQASESEMHKDDIWVERGEDGEPVSFIQCEEEQSGHSVSYCEHYFMLKPKLRAMIKYDKSYLPEWQTIKMNVDALLGSFRSKKTAHDFCVSKADKARCMGEKP